MIGFLHPLLERLEGLWLENQPPPSRSLAATPLANDAACSGRNAAESLSLSGGAQITPRSNSNCTNSPCHRVTVSWMMMMMRLKVTFTTLNTLKLLKLDVCSTKVCDE